ncbi:MAG: hypothetical protein NVS2B16_20080 [Chloroflexota bacterium]
MTLFMRLVLAVTFVTFAAVTPRGAKISLVLAQTLPPPSANASIFATGLNNPRELKFGPDGALYVAEGGTGGTNSTSGQCTQVPDVGPYTGSKTGGRISRIASDGSRTTVTDTLPSSQTSAQTGSLISGAADVAFNGQTLYALETGAGCSHGVANSVNGVYQINPDGTWQVSTNLTSFLMANPVAHPNPGDFEPDGTWWSMVLVNGALYVIEPNHGELDKIDLRMGQVSRIADISASQGHIVPTAMAYYNGNFYVGNLGLFPVTPGSSKILKIAMDGTVTTAVTGLTTVLGLAFDAQGQMYALESMTAAGEPSPAQVGTGKVVRETPSGVLETVVSGLTFPSGMTFGPDGQLYISNAGYVLPPGAGQIVRARVTALACGTVSAFTGATSTTTGTITVIRASGTVTYPIAAGTTLTGPAPATGSNMCVRGNLNTQGQVMSGSVSVALAALPVQSTGQTHRAGQTWAD